MARLDLRLFGGFVLHRLDQEAEVHLPTKKTQALFAYLALQAGRAVSREILANLLWGELADRQARHNLSQALSSIRKAVQPVAPDVLHADVQSVTLDPGFLDVDVARFETQAANGAVGALGEAMELYKGDLLLGLNIAETAFEEWLFIERGRHRERAVSVLRRLLDHHTALGHSENAVQVALRLLAFDPFAEEIHRKLMALYQEQGRLNAAIGQYRVCAEVLDEELGIEPQADTIALYHDLLDQRAAQVAEAQRGEAAGATVPTIAVLPFDNLSGDPGQTYFSDGVTEDIITELARFSDLRVVARNSTFVFRDQALDATEAGRKLGARYLVEGSVRSAGNRVRVTTQLIDVESGNHVWAERYDRGLEDIFAVQDEVTNAIVAQLAGRVRRVDMKHASHKRAESLEAYDYYLRGLHFHHRYSLEDMLEGRRMMEKAVALDPTFGTAQALLAWHTLAPGWWEPDARPSAVGALPVALKAVELDPDNGVCEAILGAVYLYAGEFEQSTHHTSRAVTLNPNDPWILAARAHLLSSLGRNQDAFEKLLLVERYEPFPPNWHYELLGTTLYGLERYAEAAEAFRRMTHKNFWDHSMLAACYGQLGRRDETQEQWAKCRAFRPDKKLRDLGEGEAYENEADKDRWLEGLLKAGLSE
jgi:TolB-like protein/Flp pilus assembly protein TadD